jgi:Protein of unknown function (DUF3570)
VRQLASLVKPRTERRTVARCTALLIGFAVVAQLAASQSEARADETGPIRPEASHAPKAPDATSIEQAFAAKDDPEEGWRWLEMRYRLAFFYQQGHGLQSQSGEDFNTQAPVTAAGSERAFIVEPLTMLKVRQSKHVTHEVYLPVDIVTAASPDALDVIATASQTNEAFAADFTSTYSPNKMSDFAFRYGVHIEEPLRSFDAGPSFTLHFFEDNTVLNLSAFIVSDGFDPLSPKGHDFGYASRSTFTGNVSLTQVLSPTTVLDASVALTEQWGTLAQSWNSVIAYQSPTEGDGTPARRIAEQFPDSRNRNAFSVKLSQFIPATSTTIKGSYRFYFDENNVFAHTGEIEIYQYIVPWLYVRLDGRLHTQTAIDFWTPFVVDPVKGNEPRTSDSDLEALQAREVGAKIVLLRDHAPRSFRASDSFDLGYLHYWRSNDLSDDYVSFGYEKRF